MLFGNGSKVQEDKIAQRINFARRYFCRKTKLHEDSFTLRVSFARVTILHGRSFSHESKKTKKKLIKKQKEKKILTEGKG